MLIAFSIAPSGAYPDADGDSVGDVVADAVRVVRESGLPNETTAMFTTIEAPTWEEGMDVVRRAVEAVQARAPRVSLVLKADIRPGHTGQLTAKVERVEQALRRGGPAEGGDAAGG
ncbi:thiamine-binding protein [Pseudonocardia humida]|uniref:Thiamine-binding protein n=1 Tax=Pseudonocardia humida TaxID=2800819 RepID=A0ABT1A586_9PSEU|nr:thiamine-binding protein [Pseudonocardia humida]MCO1658187.1 thiamine-binding protein [Pseudonocardia humida]